jgi:tripartite-type tricarboxylate transporter receptor subunit TctC
MMISKRSLLAGTAAVGLGLKSVGFARAESYPSKPIKLILPYTPGSPNDVLARLVVPNLALRLDQAVIIDNRPGGGTVIGVKAVMNAEPDGYTLLFTNTPTHVIAAVLNKNLPYDPIRDFVPVAMFGSTSLVLVISPTVPARSLQEFINYAKANPGQLNFGFGQGTLPHLVGEAFKLTTGADIASIPYKGGAQAMTDMLGGRIHMNLGAGVTLSPLIREGKVRALAVTSPTRISELPNVPTMAESGLPKLTSVTYYGILGPSGMAPDVVARLNSDANKSLQSSALKESMARAGFEPKGGSAQSFAAMISDDMQKWTSIVKATGIQME